MWLAVLAIVLVLCLFLWLDTVKPRNFPPGPPWLPLFGSAIEVYKLRQKTGYLYKAVQEISVTYAGKNGALLGLKIGKDKIVMANSWEANKEMLYNEDIDGRPKGIFYQTRTWGEHLGVIMTDGELWKEHRVFLLKHLKKFGYGRQGMAEIAVSEGRQMVDDMMSIINENNEKHAVLYMHNFFTTYILNTLWTMMAGLRYKARDPEMKVLQNLLFDLFAAVDMVGALFSHFPVLSIVAPKRSGYKNFIKTHEAFWTFLRKELARHKQNFDRDREDRDFMDAYIRAIGDMEGRSVYYSEGQLVAICMDLFMAGTETTSKSMSFCFSYLVRDQRVQKEAQAEIDRVVGRDRMPNWNDRPNMPYNEAVMHECIRHFMGRTFSIPHRAYKNTKLAGYSIPKNTMVVSNIPNLLMDENLYPEPYSFIPERFIVDGKVVLPEHYIPFGLAKHRCMGEPLSRCNIFIFTTTMLQNFSFLPVPGQPPPPLDHLDGATASSLPFKALVLPRPLGSSDTACDS